MLTFYENTVNQLHIVLLTQLISNISYSNSVTSTLVIYNPYFNTTQKNPEMSDSPCERECG